MVLGVDATLKDHLMEELDYALLSKAAWNRLICWYGLSATSRPICRSVNMIIIIIIYSDIDAMVLSHFIGMLLSMEHMSAST